MNLSDKNLSVRIPLRAQHNFDLFAFCLRRTSGRLRAPLLIFDKLGIGLTGKDAACTVDAQPYLIDILHTALPIGMIYSRSQRQSLSICTYRQADVYFHRLNRQTDGSVFHDLRRHNGTVCKYRNRLSFKVLQPLQSIRRLTVVA